MKAAGFLVGTIIVLGLLQMFGAPSPLGLSSPPPAHADSVWWVGAESVDSSALPNSGVRSTIQVLSLAVTGCLSLWVADDASDGIWGQVGYYICNGSTPVAFYQVWSLSSSTVLGGGSAAVGAGMHTFSMNLQSGTTWVYSVDGTPIGTYDMGASISSATYPVEAISEEQGSSVFTFPAATFDPAIQVMKSATWSSVSSGTSYGNSWGVEGEVQVGSLAADEIIVGGSVPVITQGTSLWNSGSTTTTSSSVTSMPPVTTTQTATSTVTSTVSTTQTATVTSTTSTTSTKTSTVTSTSTATATTTLSTTATATTTKTTTFTTTSTVTSQSNSGTATTTTATVTSTSTVTQASTATSTVTRTTTLTTGTTSTQSFTTTVTSTLTSATTLPAQATSTATTTQTITSTEPTTVSVTITRATILTVLGPTTTTTATKSETTTVTKTSTRYLSTSPSNAIASQSLQTGQPSAQNAEGSGPSGLAFPAMPAVAIVASIVGIGAVAVASRRVLARIRENDLRNLD